ncbi:phosphatidate cytidylyltransferase [Aeromicrobium sp. 636]|uniref:Phosphatidate cytidylyltransferase n=1 Tax=Aeromicrobium senzhongii TaxID=2663859 RepID=A0A8I0ETH1_9ACTN|nr:MULTISPECIES: phosphatidate cytidylyltransferase [Aeromicrobium]MBC9224735.1 phosphatidate cytidylyltransferase [Aeromicrobium senzhongii]MCQ3996848.1 phosphatidate cytidylyltransferase [Aeromicrobium sp. 636]MTB86780.1 phosphatidate cytidylyltransferase [Aeromicrobium senzhongii]QNL93376.1 phosphatidate cytidylyltransferase [Aeromicrobium senzhongii]
MTSDVPTPDPAAQKKTGRAGRDLPAAIAVGVTLVAVVLLSLIWFKDLFGIVVVVALVVAAFELSRALATAGIRVPLPPVLAGGVTMLVVGYYDDMETATAVMALTVIATMAWRLRSGSAGFVRDATAGIFLLSYLFLMGTFVLRMLTADDGPWRVVAFILVTIASDIGGYAAGVLFGKHPMAPTISPKKSWEGFAGSMVASVAAGILIVVFALEGPWWAGLVLGIAGVCFATLGDLCESLIKRDVGIKDMGDLLPGHGGLMDRLDSLIAVAPVAYLVMYLLV